VSVVRRPDRVVVDLGEWRTAVASRGNDDGSVSLIGIDPLTAPQASDAPRSSSSPRSSERWQRPSSWQ